MPLTAVFTIRDAKGAKSTVEVNLDVATIANAQTFITAFAPLVDALILGVIERVGICASATLPGGLRTTPTLGSDVEEGARFQYQTAGGFHTGLRLPTFNEAFLVDGTQRVDTADAAVIAFNTAMEDGLATFEPSDYRGDDIINLRSALESFQKTRARISS